MISYNCLKIIKLKEIWRETHKNKNMNATSNMISPHLTYKLRWVADKTSVKNTFKFNCLHTAIRGKKGERWMKRNFFYSFSRNLYERVKESKNNSTTDFPAWLILKVDGVLGFRMADFITPIFGLPTSFRPTILYGYYDWP